MKKAYMPPTAAKLSLAAESMLAQSPVVDPSKETDIILSGKRGWSASDWSGNDDSED